MSESDTRDDAPTVRLQRRDLPASAIPQPRRPEPDRPAATPTAPGGSTAWLLLAIAAVVLAVAAAITAGMLTRPSAHAPPPPGPIASAATPASHGVAGTVHDISWQS